MSPPDFTSLPFHALVIMKKSLASSNNSLTEHIFRYGPEEVKSYAENSPKLFENAFFAPSIGKFLELEASGKRILDIGCGTGDWCLQAAQHGAVRVDGFDRQEAMVKIAKQVTSRFNAVKIQLADIMNMPYDDNTFDIALSIYVTCELPVETISKHFSELYRVLVPGGKALVLNLSNPIYQRMYLSCGTNEEVVQKKINQALAHIPMHPTQKQINESFEDLRKIFSVCFAYDKSGSLFQVKDVNQLINGQAVLHKTVITTFPNFYYDDQFLVDQTTAAGLRIDKIENIHTEERRIIHNIQNTEAQFSKDIVDHPFCLLYHISKPT